MDSPENTSEPKPESFYARMNARVEEKLGKTGTWLLKGGVGAAAVIEITTYIVLAIAAMKGCEVFMVPTEKPDAAKEQIEKP